MYGHERFYAYRRICGQKNGKLLLDEVLESPVHYQKMMKILHEFDESIINIAKSGNGTEYMILSKKYRKALPLNAYGDGMKKAFIGSEWYSPAG